MRYPAEAMSASAREYLRVDDFDFPVTPFEPAAYFELLARSDAPHPAGRDELDTQIVSAGMKSRAAR
jgi:hypothetical protein